MERLTAKDEGECHYYYIKCHEECDGNPSGWDCENCNHDAMVCDKLGRYEDQEELGIMAIMTDEAAVSINLEKAKEWVDAYDAIRTLWQIGIFDGEERAVHGHNLLDKIIEEFRRVK